MESPQYKEIEKRVLKAVLEPPTFDRWASLCSLMSDGVYAATELHDQDLPRCGWLHICARYLAIVPKRENRDSRLAPNEFLGSEIGSYCKVFKPVVRSLRHYMQTIYPNFNPKTGKWSRAGKEDKGDNPFPFFLSEYLSEEEDDVSSLVLLFEVIPEDCGEVFRWEPSFHKELELLTDDYDAELEYGDFAGNVGENEIKEIVAHIDEEGDANISQSELDTLANMMVASYEATVEMHRSILENRGVGQFASDDFDRSSLFHSSCIQSALVVFQPHIIKEIERSGLKIQQYHTNVCDAIDVANKVHIAWKSFFRELKRQFDGDPNIVAAEAAALSLTGHYAMKVASEGGGLHVSAGAINAEYNAFIKQLERVGLMVAQHDYLGDSAKKGAQDVKMSDKVNIVQFNGCENFQVSNNESWGIQVSTNVHKGAKKAGVWSLLVTVMIGIISAFIKRYICADK